MDSSIKGDWRQMWRERYRAIKASRGAEAARTSIWAERAVTSRDLRLDRATKALILTELDLIENELDLKVRGVWRLRWPHIR